MVFFFCNIKITCCPFLFITIFCNFPLTLSLYSPTFSALYYNFFSPCERQTLDIHTLGRGEFLLYRYLNEQPRVSMHIFVRTLYFPPTGNYIFLLWRKVEFCLSTHLFWLYFYFALFVVLFPVFPLSFPIVFFLSYSPPPHDIGWYPPPPDRGGGFSKI